MSWSRRDLLSALGAVLPLAAGGCGFRPLYGGPTDARVPAEFTEIQIRPIKDQIGHELHNKLRDLINPRGVPDRPRYFLVVELNESIQGTAIQRTAFATRANLQVTANYRLVRALSAEETRRQSADEERRRQGLPPLPPSGSEGRSFSGSSLSVSSYDIFDQDFATLAAEKNARTRALTEIAEDIRTRLAIHFRR